MRLKLLIILLGISIFIPSRILCLEKVVKSNIGTDFFIAFPNNYHDDDEVDTIFKEIKLYIYAVEGNSANIKLSYYNYEFIEKQFTALPNQVLEIDVDTTMEIFDINKAERKGILINSDNPIVVYCLNKYYKTTDAYIAYPINTLDTSYISVSYENSLIGSYIERTKSALTVLAVEDNTIVRILPTFDLEYNINRLDTLIVNLNKYETYMVHAADMRFFDLTGTKIYSNKNIAVWGSHERASLIYISTRDHLIEQLPPINVLGANYILTPMYNNEITEYMTLFRIVKVFDNTAITINGIKTEIKGKYLDTIDEKPLVIKSDKPILTAIYNVPGLGEDGLGDPSMSIIPPYEQYMNEYHVISIPHKEFLEHYLNLIVPKSALASLTLDGANVNQSEFKEVSGTGFVWADIKVSAGSHYLKADEGFGIVAYGLGIADSYGYTGGMRMENIINSIMDKNPPIIAENTNCKSKIELSEKREYDTGIDTINLVTTDNVKNTQIQIDTSRQSANISYELIDEMQDGEYIIKVSDKNSNIAYDTVSIAGYTIKAEINGLDTLEYYNKYDDTLRITNYGKFVQKLNLKMYGNIIFSVPPSKSEIEVFPGETIEIPVVIFPQDIGRISDTLCIKDICGRKLELFLHKQVVAEDYYSESKCGTNIRFRFYKAGKVNIYSKSMNIVNSFGLLRIYTLTGEMIKEIEVNGTVEIVLDEPSGIYPYVFTTKDNQIIRGLWNRE